MAVRDLSFNMPGSKKTSESMRVDHNFGDFSQHGDHSDIHIDGQVQARYSKETLSPKSVSIEDSVHETEEDEIYHDDIILDDALLAKIKSRLASKTSVAPSYATLFVGLKRNHPRKVAIVNPLLYMIRRIIFVATAISFVS